MRSEEATDVQKLRWLGRYKYTEREIPKQQDRLEEIAEQYRARNSAGISCYEYRPEQRTAGGYKDPTARAAERIEEAYTRAMDLLLENAVLFSQMEAAIEALPTETARRVYRKKFFNGFGRPVTPRENGHVLTSAERETVLLENLQYIEIPQEYLDKIPRSQRGF